MPILTERMLTTTIFVLSVLLSGTLAVSCPNGYKNLYAHHCYKLYSDCIREYDTAKFICQKDGAMPVSIHNIDENEAVQAECRSKGIEYIFLGLECQANGTKAWSDGTPFDFDNTVSGNTGCNRFHHLQMQVDDGSWFSLNFGDDDDDESWPFCKIEVSYPTGGTECGTDYELLESAGICVRAGLEMISWNFAEQVCQTEGAHLASIHSKQAENYLRRLAVSNKLINGVFIGFTLNYGNVSWVDQTDLDYANFDSGMPNRLFGNCGLMDTRSLEAKWMSVNCDDRNKLPYLCSKPIPCPSDNTFTVQGVVHSPEYPSSHTRGLNCEYLLAASANSKVQLKFDELKLLDGDAVLLYEGMSSSLPFAVITSATPNDTYRTVADSVLRIVHATDAESGARYWSASFVSV